MSLTMPPPKAITMLERSPPRRTISSASCFERHEPLLLLAAGQVQGFESDARRGPPRASCPGGARRLQ